MNMKELRIRSGKRPENLASELDLSISTIRNWEQLKTVPRATPLIIKKIMQSYGCSFEELVQAEEEVRHHGI